MRSEISGILTGKTGEVYNKVLDNINKYSNPAEFIHEAWGIYEREFNSSPSVNGRIFEYLVAETLIRERIQPVYYQVKFNLIPNCEFDIVLYHPKAPVVLSAKVSLRERYKQADLEGMALRQVYRQAEQHLITLSDGEANANKKKIETGDIVGLNSILVANKPEYTVFLNTLKKVKFERAVATIPLTGRLIPELSM